jgi:hypothetical protein
MQREKASGMLLIASALMLVLVMTTHPTGHQMVSGTADAHRLIYKNMVVHGVAIASAPLLFLGLLGLSRRLGFTDLTIAALVFHGFAGTAVLSAALTSGFVASGVIHEFVAAEAAQRDLYSRLLEYTHFFNQAYAGVYVAASSVAILLWSAAMIRGGRMSRAAGWAGVVVSSLILVFHLAGHLNLDVHGFGVITVAQGAWLIWVGILMLKDSPAQGQPG